MATDIQWHGKAVMKKVLSARKKALRQAGRLVARKSKSICRVGVEEIFRKKGGPDWSGRVPGTLKKSIRYQMVKKGAKVQVIAGNRYAFYARFVEFGTAKMVARPFLRPSLESSSEDIVTAFSDKMPN